VPFAHRGQHLRVCDEREALDVELSRDDVRRLDLRA
jgi:hypothetical protein